MLSILLMMSPNGQQGGGSTSMILFLLIMVAMYFVLIRPQSRRMKKQKEFVNQLEKGLKVVTLSGIHGKIVKMNEDSTIEVEVSPGTSIKMERSSISMEMTQAIAKASPALTDAKEKSEK